MRHLALVFLGSGIGAVARHALGGLVFHHSANWRFPLSTLLVNALGCLVAGALAGAVERAGMLSPDARLFLFTGLLGGFTTFSAFGLDTLFLLRRGEVAIALAYISLSLLFGVLGLWAMATIHIPR
jgi:CrcB protein